MRIMARVRFKDLLNDYLEYSHISNKEFASRLDITPKHLTNILSGKQNLSAEIIEKISMITNIPIEYIYKMEADSFLEDDIENYLKVHKLTATEFLKKWEYRFLIKNNYIDFSDTENKMNIIKDIVLYLRVPTIEQIYKIDNGAFYKSKNDKPELLLLWLEKCYRKMLNEKVLEYQKENVMVLVNYILDSAKDNKFNEEELIRVFNENGVYLVIEDDIPGSKIRGAFKVHKDAPAIYITRKYKRIADVYFALFHELAHLKSDYNSAKARNFVSYEDEAEDKADMVAYDWMVNDEYYNKVCKKANYSIEKENKYPKSFVVYRLAQDRLLSYKSKIYQKYNFLLEKNSI